MGKGRTSPSRTLQLGLQLHQRGKLDQAASHYRAVLTAQPRHFDAMHLLGLLQFQQGRHIKALDLMNAALRLKPDAPVALSNLGLVLGTLGRLDEALASFDKALAIRPDFAEALNNRGNVLLRLARFREALACFDKAVAIDPDNAEALNNRGKTLVSLDRPAEALASFDRALAVRPDYAEARYDRGTVLLTLKRPLEALASFDKALATSPADAEILYIRGKTLFDLGRAADAVASFDKALAVEPGHVGALGWRGNAFLDLKRPEEALASFDRAHAIEPDNAGVIGGRLLAALQACRWTRVKEITDQLVSQKTWRQSPMLTFNLFACCDDPSVHLDCARYFTQSRIQSRKFSPAPRWNAPPRPRGKLRIAYMSADFRLHPMTTWISELIELHDRVGFEVFGISVGVDDGSERRLRLARAFDRFLDVRSRSDRDIVQLLDELHVDIAIDLMGHTRDGRPAILAARPAPIQVSYIGYPGTTGADFIDYVIADPIVLPFDQQPYYTERIVHLPDSYMVTDSKRAVPSSVPTRQVCALPGDAFVFCCFNSNYKVTQGIFEIWMRLLAASPGSVLWLLGGNADAERNLRQAAQERGVDATRLVFAPPLPYEKHLARHRQADLFLDTLPYNAHTTASDALWIGLPLVTCTGRSFASRVAASALHAAGLPELVTHTLADYESLALRLAADPALLGGYRQRLEENRHTCALFDTARFARNIEAAYIKMWEFHRRGESPQSFSVSE